MKTITLLFALFFSVSMSFSQEKSIKVDFLETGSQIWRTGYIYYKIETNGDYLLTRYSISGVENGRQDFPPNTYPMNVGQYGQPKEGVKYNFKTPTGCCWMAYFN